MDLCQREEVEKKNGVELHQVFCLLCQREAEKKLNTGEKEEKELNKCEKKEKEKELGHR